MKFTLPKKTRTLLQIRAVIITAFVCVVPAYLGVVLSPYAYIAAAVLIVLCVFTVLFYIPRFVKGASLSVTKEGVVVKYGLFYKFEQIMPVLRLVFVETHQTPVARIMGLCAVSFLGVKARVTFPEIDKKDAERLTAFVRAVGEGDLDE